MKIIKEISINNLKLKNRIVRSATWEGLCDDNGAPGRNISEIYSKLAENNVGLIISGYTNVSSDGKQLRGQMGLHDDSLSDGHIRLISSVHSAGSKICAQLVHCGGFSMDKDGKPAPSPSCSIHEFYGKQTRAMTEEDIQRIILNFINAARRAKEYGYDAVQIHGAHGYLVSQFLSPHTNKRDDHWGGSEEKRLQFAIEIVSSIRKAVGINYPILIKINGNDYLEEGLTLETSVNNARKLVSAGVDAFEISGGTPASGELSPVRKKIKAYENEAYLLKDAEKFKKVVDVPIISVGGYRSIEKVEEALGSVDLISISRPFIKEPDLITKWLSGVSKSSECISCNGCFRPAIKGEGIKCVI